MKRYTLKERFGYWFDNLMAQGMMAKVKLLLLITVAFAIVLGFASVLAYAGADGNPFQNFWTTVMYVFGKGGAPSIDNGPVWLALMVVAIVYCMLFTAILIGLINSGIKAKMDSLSKGRGKVLEQGHILILGFNDATLVLLSELIEANKNQLKQQRIVVLDDMDWQEMTDKLRSRFGKTRNHPKTKIICKSGPVFSFRDLSRCSIETARVVIINGDTEFDTVRAIVASSHLLHTCDVETPPYMVSVLHGNDNILEVSAAIESVGLAGLLEHLSIDETLARVMVHTSRQPGLSHVFTELFNYADDEFYIVDDDAAFPRLYGKSIAEINLMLKSAFAIGTCDKQGAITIAPPNEAVFNKGDSLIVLQEDDNPLSLTAAPASITAPSAHAPSHMPASTILIIGFQPALDAVLVEYAHYLARGSIVHLAGTDEDGERFISTETREALAGEEVELHVHHLDDLTGGSLTRLLDACSPEGVLVLVDHDADNREADDEKTIRTLVHLRNYRSTRGVSFSITSEIHDELNKELVTITGPDDFIVGRHIAALLMAQIAQKREMAELFRVLLSSEGFEVYMKDAGSYVELGKPIDLFSVSQAVADQGEMFIGVRQKKEGSFQVADINPSKFTDDGTTLRKYTFGEDDSFVVLADA